MPYSLYRARKTSTCPTLKHVKFFFMSLNYVLWPLEWQKSILEIICSSFFEFRLSWDKIGLKNILLTKLHLNCGKKEVYGKWRFTLTARQMWRTNDVKDRWCERHKCRINDVKDKWCEGQMMWKTHCVEQLMFTYCRTNGLLIVGQMVYLL